MVEEENKDNKELDTTGEIEIKIYPKESYHNTLSAERLEEILTELTNSKAFQKEREIKLQYVSPEGMKMFNQAMKDEALRMSRDGETNK